MKRTVLSIALAMMAGQGVWSQPAVITEAKGWLESAYVKWQPVEGAGSYNVYYTGEGIADRKIDTQLIRNYGSYYRADVLGLKAGTYTVKVVPVIGEAEGEAAVAAGLTVRAHDRSGFAHAADSPQKTASGAYNDDGTLKANAEVVYVTPATAKDVDVYANILKPREKNNKQKFNPVAIRFIGYFKQADVPGINSVGLLQLKGASESIPQEVTFEGVGDDTYWEFGVDLVRCSNVEVRNLAFKAFNEDAVSIQSGNTNMWVHNNDFFYGQNKGGDKKKGDGATDIKDSQWCTVSYNHYWDSGKANLFGNSDDKIDYISYHHNYLDHSDSRHPRVRCAQRMHVYNNYYRGTGKYGVGAARQSSIFAEGNYFENSKNPMMSSMQGTDILDGDGTFSNEDGGIIKAYNNKIVGLKGNYRPWAASGQQNTEFDAYEVAGRADRVPATVKAKQGGATYSNFDQDLQYKEFRLDTPDEAKANVMQYAGRVDGGDLKIEFGANDYLKTDDPDPSIVSVLGAYTSSIVGWGAGGSTGDNPGDGGEDNPGGGDDNPVVGGMTHNFTTQGKESSFFTIAGNLSTSKGTVTYGGMTLTQCLKMESATKISFTTTEEATLTLVFNDGFSGSVKVDGESHTASNGVLTLVIAAGSHEITKGDTANLFYMSVAYAEPPATVTGQTDGMQLALYPNPVAGYLHVGSDAEVQAVEVYTLQGAAVRREAGRVTAVDMSSLPAGTYFVRVHTAQGVGGTMVIKK